MAYVGSYHVQSVAVFCFVVLGQAPVVLAVQRHHVRQNVYEVAGVRDLEGHLKVLDFNGRIIAANAIHSVAPIYSDISPYYQSRTKCLGEIVSPDSALLDLFW